jgi:hypothetical protein
MTNQEIQTKLNELFNARYSKDLAELNKNVYISAKNSKGSFEVPVPILGKGGGTVLSDDVTKLNPPACVNVKLKTMLSQKVVYRIFIPFDECKIAAEKTEYFNYLFDAVVSKAIGNYKVTFGDENKVRFGTKYITANLPDSSDIFMEASVGDEIGFEFRFTGEWASQQEDLT